MSDPSEAQASASGALAAPQFGQGQQLAPNVPQQDSTGAAVQSDTQRADHQAGIERKARLDAVLTKFWREQIMEVNNIKPGPDCSEMKNHPLPLARIKKIMKSDEDVRMISAEAPVVFAKACELFILELTHRAWAHSEDNRRRTLQRSDVAAAIAETDVLDFLLDIIPKEEGAEGGAPAASITVNSVQQQQHTTQPQIMYGMPAGGMGVSQGQAMPQQGAVMQAGLQPQMQYMQYMQWPGMQGGVQPGMQMGVTQPQQDQGSMPMGMVMDPKMQAHMAQQMAAAQQQYMQRQQQQMQRPQPVHLPTMQPAQPQQAQPATVTPQQPSHQQQPSQQGQQQ